MWNVWDLDRGGSAERTLGHLSDLHIGRSAANDDRAARLCRALLDADVDHVVVTGDLTHRGRADEWARFRAIFAPLLDGGRLTVIPGNHDRLGDDVGEAIMPGPRVQVEQRPGLFLVRLNSTGPHNRSWLMGHGLVTAEDIAAVDGVLADAPTEDMVVLLLHHHPMPLPHDHAVERLSSMMGWKFTSELDSGAALIGRLRHRCDLVLHGHRHRPAAQTIFDDARPLRIFNAGSSTELGKGCLFRHRDGRLSAPLRWLEAVAPAPIATAEQAGLWSRVEHDLSTLAGHQLAF